MMKRADSVHVNTKAGASARTALCVGGAEMIQPPRWSSGARSCREEPVCQISSRRRVGDDEDYQGAAEGDPLPSVSTVVRGQRRPGSRSVGQEGQARKIVCFLMSGSKICLRCSPWCGEIYLVLRPKATASS